MYMIKSNGGSGTVSNIAFNNFVGHSNAYSLDFDTAWSSMSTATGDGITYSNISFDGWTGTCANGKTRGPIKVKCPAAVPCTDISITDFNMWTDTGSSILYTCANAYGSGACLNSGSSHTTYATTQTITTATGYSYTTMANELKSGWPLTASIPIPSLPASFFPGKQPISAILSGSAGSAATAATAVVTKATSSAKTTTARVTSSVKSSSTSKAASTLKTSTKTTTAPTSKKTTSTSKMTTSKVKKSSAAVVQNVATGVADITQSESVSSSSSSASTLASAAAQSAVTEAPSASASKSKGKCGSHHTVTKRVFVG
jgi:rhamnogalacturonan hydrolase